MKKILSALLVAAMVLALAVPAMAEEDGKLLIWRSEEHTSELQSR